MTTASDMVERYREAEEAILEGQSVQWGNRRLGMPDLLDIRKGRHEWEQRLAAEQRGSRISPSVARFTDG